MSASPPATAIVIGPVKVARYFGLEPPCAAELRRAHFAFSAILISVRPYVLTRHRTETLH